MSFPVLSIIMPVYNTGSYINHTLQSVLQQRFTDFELILPDDGSTDESSILCDQYAEMDNRIVVIHQKNAGVAAARNTGLNSAEGQFIGFVDSDDLISPIMYQIMLNIAREKEADIVQCSHTRNPEELVCCADTAQIQTEVLNNIESLKRIYRTHYTNSMALWSKIYKSEVFHDIRFTVGTAFEDDEIVPCLLERGCRNAFFDIPLYCYVKHENSIITAPKIKNIMALTSHLEHRMLHYQELDDELYQIGLKHFFGYLKGKSQEQYFLQTEVQTQAIVLLKKYQCRFWKIGDKYDRFGLCCLSVPFLQRWLIKNSWEPIQNLLRKVKGEHQ